MIDTGSQPRNASPRARLCTWRYTWAVSFRLHVHRTLAAGLVMSSVLGTAAAEPGRPPATTPPAPSADADKPARTPLDEARDGVVVIERRGRPVGLGFVLTGDGRVLTSLSVIGDGNHVDARYADGSLVGLKVGHSDRVWDLALLVPQVGRWEGGLRASTADPLAQGSHIRTFAKRGRAAQVASVVLKGRTELLGGDGELLRDAIEITTRIPASDMGAPLVDEQGRVLGLVGNACKPVEGKPDAPCRPVAYGVPLDALRQFLRSAPANAIPPSPWLGIQGVAATTPVARGVRVVHVHPSSPAAAALLEDGKDGKGNDIIVAVDGTPVLSPEQLADIVRARAVGDGVQLIVLRAGKFHVVQTTLTAAPSPSRSAAKTGP